MSAQASQLETTGFAPSDEGAKGEALPPVEDRDALHRIVAQIATLESERSELIATAEADIARVEEWLRGENRRIDAEVARRKAVIQPWAAERIERDGAGRRSLTTPHGRVGFRAQQPHFDREEMELVVWSRQKGFVRVKEEVDWAAIKKAAHIRGERLVMGDGEIVPGVRVCEQPDRFYVEVG